MLWFTGTVGSLGAIERFDGSNPAVSQILIIRWKSIGDVAFTLPAVNRLRDNFPEARLTFLVSKENAFVARIYSVRWVEVKPRRQNGVRWPE